MDYILFFMLTGLIMGLVVVASSPASHFAAIGLVLAAGFGCGMLAGHGGSFLSLMLFLIYIGGMLVVFAYSAALSVESFPKGLGDSWVVGRAMAYLLVLCVVGLWLCNNWYNLWVVADNNLFMIRGDCSGAALVYAVGGEMLIVSGWALFLSLFVVLELIRGFSRGTLRAV
uniref:NADH-ubiquinone oxidoreductase chain 6 n=1 Tax=Crenuchus spilurus TaxID=909854 RepID=F7UIK4_9TELE|nr:NADH dehydrogenase subunit 6 [Crenuchus spilurus]